MTVVIDGVLTPASLYIILKMSFSAVMRVWLQEPMILELWERHLSIRVYFQVFIFPKLWTFISFFSSDFLLLLTTRKFLCRQKAPMQMKAESQFCIKGSGSCCLTWFQADERGNTVVQVLFHLLSSHRKHKGKERKNGKLSLVRSKQSIHETFLKQNGYILHFSVCCHWIRQLLVLSICIDN